MEGLRKAKFQHIIDATKDIVLKEGISHLTISKIAEDIHVGEATIYRYFGTKTKLIIEIGVSLWEDALIELKSRTLETLAIDNIRNFYHIFYDLFVMNKNIFKVIDEFDLLLAKESIDQSLLDDYNAVILKVKSIFDEFYQQGLIDGSVNPSLDANGFYFSSTHMLLGLCKKLATQYHLIPCDDCVEDIQQIKQGIDIIIKYIEK